MLIQSQECTASWSSPTTSGVLKHIKLCKPDQISDLMNSLHKARPSKLQSHKGLCRLYACILHLSSCTKQRGRIVPKPKRKPASISWRIAWSYVIGLQLGIGHTVMLTQILQQKQQHTCCDCILCKSRLVLRAKKLGSRQQNVIQIFLECGVVMPSTQSCRARSGMLGHRLSARVCQARCSYRS